MDVAHTAILASGVALGIVLIWASERAGSRAAAVRPKKDEEDEEKKRDAQAEGLDARGTLGFSMQDALTMVEAGQRAAMRRRPAEVLAELQRGNTRFWMGKAKRPESSAFERRSLISRQFPSTAILGCADSRVPVELVFDQGLGDMFVVRVAGNCLDTASAASLLYAVNHLKVKVLVVMGHEFCGAVKACRAPEAGVETIEKKGEASHLRELLVRLRENMDLQSLEAVKDPRANDREAVLMNVRAQLQAIEKDPNISAKVAAGELLVAGAFYEISSGIVDFFVSEPPEAPKAAPKSSPKAASTSKKAR